MNLKDAIASDIPSVLNTDEFADLRTINGKQMKAIVDQHLDKERFDKTSDNYIDGVFLDIVVVYVSVSDFGAKPLVGETLKIDNDRYYVLNCSEMGGMYEIKAEANRS